MRFQLCALLLGLLALVATAGCTTTSAGSPKPTSNSSSVKTTAPEPSDSDELPFAGAPAVDNPLDTSKYQDDPCQALTPAQAQELNVSGPREPRDGGLGNACEFRGSSDRRALVEIASLDKYPKGISAAYRANEDGKWEHFEELAPIEGYPAISYDALDQRDTGACSVIIGTSDEIAFEIALQLSTENVGSMDPCETAAMVAGMVLRTMKAGS